MKILFTAVSVGIIGISGVLSTPALADATVCAPHTTQRLIPKKDGKTMSRTKQNPSENLHRSRCMIELILEDITTNYGGVGGGGISSIKAVSSSSYMVSLPQEERIDLMTYEFDFKPDGTIVLKGKVASTQSVGPKSADGNSTKK